MSTQQENLHAEEGGINMDMRMLANKRERPVLCLCGFMGGDSVEEARNLLHELRGFDTLSVLLNSPGGYIEEAYRMVLALREHAKDIEVLVPHRAKSAATFFCLAADTIYMGKHGELGPLDPQRLDLQGSTMRRSPLESFQALDQILKFSMDSLDAVVRQLLSRSPMDIPHAIERAQPFFAAIVSPLYSNVDLRELGDAGMALDVNEEYAVRVMERWGYSDMEEEDIQLIAGKLVWDYPTHGFVIDLTEAQDIGLKAKRLDEGSEAISQAVCQRILESTGEYIGVALPDAQGLHVDYYDDEAEHGGEKDNARPQPEGSTEDAGSRR